LGTVRFVLICNFRLRFSNFQATKIKCSENRICDNYCVVLILKLYTTQVINANRFYAPQLCPRFKRHFRDVLTLGDLELIFGNAEGNVRTNFVFLWLFVRELVSRYVWTHGLARARIAATYLDSRGTTSVLY